jgi:D-alanyl-D-alanine carboxypeptidase (penicillin-binding protein 5/6)
VTRGRVILLVAALAVVALAVNYLRPVPAVAATQQGIPLQTGGGSPPSLPWPASAQAAVGAEECCVLSATPNAKPLPIASVAKVMTALVTLEAKPLKKGEQGPSITITADDVAAYQQESANGESVVAVQAGEQLSEYQALQGTLIPSGNNLADLLARWAFGSVDAIVRRMNARAAELGMKHTRFADASGVSAQTVSVPSDLVRMGQAAMADAAFADVVRQPEATLPVAGRVFNVNGALGQDGIVGVKTGDTPQAGAVYLSAAQVKLPSGQTVLLFTAVQGLPTRDLAITAAKDLIGAVGVKLQVRRLVSANQIVGAYAAPWGSRSDVVARQDLDVLSWPGLEIRSELRSKALVPPDSPGTDAGSLHVTAGDQVYDVPIVTTSQLEQPGQLWRFVRIG